MKILISWYAFQHDFVWEGNGETAKRKNQISPDSPIWNVHKYFWEKYDKHILLNSSPNESDEKYYDFLCSELKKNFKDQIVEKEHLPITDPIDIKEISHKIQKLLIKYQDCKIDIFVSPGTPTMQVAWYLAGINFKKNVTLFQVRPPKFSKDKSKPEKVIIQLDDSVFPTNLNISSSLIESVEVKSNYVISPSIKVIYEKALSVANTFDVTCLILGENGTGKEHLANYIHLNSSRKAFPFKAVNCAAYSDELLRSELFGHKKGAFTGADRDHKGILEEANGGTVFLDEIGDISKKMQVSLLRVLQEKEIQLIGSNEVKKIDVRIIAATNKNLIELSNKDEFRWDLFFRLSVAELKLPALRERGKKEIKNLLVHFISIHSTKFPNRKSKLVIEKEAEKLILDYNFPGNIRELENLVISLYTFCKNGVEVSDLPEKIIYPFSDDTLKLEGIEKKHILKVFELFKGGISETKDALGMARNTLKSRLKKYGIRNI